MRNWITLISPDCAAPDLLWRDDVRPSEWAGLIADGAYRCLGADIAIRGDLRPNPQLRARALAPLVPTRAVLGLESASWVHIGGPMPSRVRLLVSPGARRVDQTPVRISHEADLGPEDVWAIGHTKVTSPNRTVLDLLLSRNPEDSMIWAERLVRADANIEDVCERLQDIHRRSGVRKARQLAAQLTQALMAGSSGEREPVTR